MMQKSLFLVFMFIETVFIASFFMCSMLIELVFNAGAMRKETLHVKFAMRSV